MILMGKNPFRGPLEGVGPVIRVFLGPEMTTSEASAICPKKVETPGVLPVVGFATTGLPASHSKTSMSLCPVSPAAGLVAPSPAPGAGTSLILPPAIPAAATPAKVLDPVNTAAGPALGIAAALRAVADAAAIDAATPSQIYVTCFSIVYIVF